MPRKKEDLPFLKDKEAFLALADKGKASPKPLLLSPLLSDFRAYLFDFVDREAKTDISLDFCAYADEERLITVLTLLYTELKASFADLVLSAKAIEDKAYILLSGTTKEKGEGENLLALAQAAGCDTLSLLWAEKIAKAAGIEIAFSWHGKKAGAMLTLPAFTILGAVLEVPKWHFAVESAAGLVCRLLTSLPDIEE